MYCLKKSILCVSAGNSAKKEKESKERNFIFYISFVRASISISHHQRERAKWRMVVV